MVFAFTRRAMYHPTFQAYVRLSGSVSAGLARYNEESRLSRSNRRACVRIRNKSVGEVTESALLYIILIMRHPWEGAQQTNKTGERTLRWAAGVSNKALSLSGGELRESHFVARPLGIILFCRLENGAVDLYCSSRVALSKPRSGQSLGGLLPLEG